MPFEQPPHPTAKPYKTLFEKIRKTADRIPNSVKAAAIALEQTMGGGDAMKDLADAQEIAQEKVMEEARQMESIKQSRIASAERAGLMEARASLAGPRKELATGSPRVTMDLPKGFETIDDAILEEIATSPAKSVFLNSTATEFPKDEQLSRMMTGQPTILLNAGSYYTHVPEKPFLTLSQKIQPKIDTSADAMRALTEIKTFQATHDAGAFHDVLPGIIQNLEKQRARLMEQERKT